MYILICWSVAGRPGTSVLFLGEIPMLPAHTLRPEERVKPAPPVWPTYGWATPALRPTKPAIPRVAGRPTLLSRGNLPQKSAENALRPVWGANDDSDGNHLISVSTSTDLKIRHSGVKEYA